MQKACIEILVKWTKSCSSKSNRRCLRKRQNVQRTRGRLAAFYQDAYIKLLGGSFKAHTLLTTHTTIWNRHGAYSEAESGFRDTEWAETEQRGRYGDRNTVRGGKFSFASENHGSCGFPIMIPRTLITTFASLSNGRLPACSEELKWVHFQSREKSCIRFNNEKKNLHVCNICRWMSSFKVKTFESKLKADVRCMTEEVCGTLDKYFILRRRI